MMINSKKSAVLLFVVFVLLTFSIVNSVWASSPLWNQTFGGEKGDKAFCVVETPDGGFAIVGETRSFAWGSIDVWLIKTDSNGNAQWNKTYGGQEMDMACSIIVTSDGGFALAGSTYSIDDKNDFWLVKTDSSGNMEWNQTYGEDIPDVPMYYGGADSESAQDLIQTKDGGYALVGSKIHYSRDPYHSMSYSCWIVKTDAYGNKEWSLKRGGGSSEQRGSALIETPEGDLVIVGSVYAYDSLDAYLWVLKTDAYGNVTHSNLHKTVVDNGASAIVATSDGGYVIAGGTNMFTDENKDLWLVKTDTNGDVEWVQTYSDNVDRGASSLAATSDGGYIIAGNSIVVKTDAQGNMQWNQTYDGFPHSIVAASDGGYVLAGSTKPDGEDVDFWLAKTDNMGIPEFSTWTILPLLLTVVLVLIIYKKQLAKTPNCL